MKKYKVHAGTSDLPAAQRQQQALQQLQHHRTARVGTLCRRVRSAEGVGTVNDRAFHPLQHHPACSRAS